MQESSEASIPKVPSKALVVISAAFICFVVCAVFLSHLTGAPFTAPTERVSRALGISYVIPFMIGIAGYVISQLIAYRKDKTIPLKERLITITADCYFLMLFVLVIYIHFQIKAWMPLVNPVLYDDVYFKTDEFLRPLLNGMLWVRGLFGNLSTRFDFLYQLGFLGMFAFSLWGHALSSRKWHYHNMFAILLMQMIGAFTYLIAPAVGPFINEDGPNAVATKAQTAMYEAFQKVQEQGVEWLAVHGGDYFTGPPAAMPSLHIAGATIILWYMLKIRSVFLPFIIFMFGWVFIESVVSRWHYFIDLPPGILLATICILITNRVCKTGEESQD